MAKKKRNRDWIYKSLIANKSSAAENRGIEYHVNRSGQSVRVIAAKDITPARERFDKQVRPATNTSDSDVQNSLCMIWLGAATFRVDSETVMTPRRFIWWDTFGEKLPKKTKLQTSCTTPNCVNPKHLLRKNKSKISK